MDIEDEDGKIRRNLVVASTLVLLLAWLDLPAGTVAERILTAKPEALGIASWRIWAAVVGLLAYLCLRFRFSAEVEKGVETFLEDYKEVHERQLDKIAARRGREFKSDKLKIHGLREAIRNLVASHKKRDKDVLSGLENEPTQFIAFSRIDSEPYPDGRTSPHVLRLYVRCYWSDMNVGLAEEASEFDFDTTNSERLLAATWAAFRAAIYSKGSTALVWPIALAAVAVATATWKLVVLF